MRFNLRRKPDDRPDPADSTSCSDHPPAAEEEGIDLDRWVQLAADPPGSSSGADDEAPLHHEVRSGVSLRDKLLAVLAEDDASLVPPSAGDMTQAEWDSLSEIEREWYRRQQLQQLDPRIVPRYTMGTSLSGSRSARVYR
jgi:hypothetical protein